MYYWINISREVLHVSFTFINMSRDESPRKVGGLMSFVVFIYRCNRLLCFLLL
ncbi:hypothetical protein VCR3J2_240021 [Vibrio coralliirubri]|nr:hypothetical protein VCR3J2_240021 [Vibrio coralliirubri]